MSGTSSASWWQYSKYVWTIARTMSINPPSTVEENAVEAFLNHIWNPETRTGTRPWMDEWYNKRSVSPATDYIGDPDVEPYNVDIEVLEKVGKDLKKVPLTDQEKVWCDTLFAATGNRRLGIYP